MNKWIRHIPTKKLKTKLDANTSKQEEATELMPLLLLHDQRFISYLGAQKDELTRSDKVKVNCHYQDDYTK